MTGARVWYHGRIFTGRRFVERIVAESGRIVASGSGGPTGPEVPTGAERIDLGGRLAVPAFVDAHLHVTESALRGAGVDLRGARDLSEIAERVRRRAPATGPAWGGGWDQDRLAERRMPTRRDLDRWLPDRPLVLTRVCEHVAVVNSAALGAMVVERGTPPIPGGTIEREADGSPNGILRERALGLLRHFPFPSLADRPELGGRFLSEAAALGLGAMAGLRASPEEVAWMHGGAGRGPPKGSPRYCTFGGVRSVREVEAWGRLRRGGTGSVQGIKVFADGSFGARSAWLEVPYADAPGESGGPVQPREDWEELVRSADAEGLRVAAHALGDRGLRRVLEAIEAVRPAARPRLEHAGLVPEALWTRLARLPLDVVVQPGFRTSDTWLEERLGPDRVRSAYPLASFRRRGMRLAASSDAPVESLDPMDGIRSSVDPGGFGEPIGPWEALELYTRGGAEVLELPDLGHLEVGAAASLVVLPTSDLDTALAPETVGTRAVWLDGDPVPTSAPVRGAAAR